MADASAPPPDPSPEQARIAALEAELAALRAEVQDFTYTVSHDLRASLRHILSYAQLLQEDAAPLLNAETQGFLNTITDSARHMGVLMDGLTELSRLGTAEITAQPQDLLPLLQDVQAELQARYPTHPAQPSHWLLPASLPRVLGDAAPLRAALLAVLDNALKFSAGQPQASVAITAQVEAGHLLLQVQDNGAGFNPALQSKLFKPFSRLHSAKQFPGIGMGLALTRKRMERMGGWVRAEGTVGAGCTITLGLALALLD